MGIQKYTFKFEPNDPITTPREFTDELIRYCDEKDMNLVINHEGMEPVVTIDNIKYIAMLEQPKMIDIPILPIHFTHGYGYEWVYLYKYER